MDAGAATGIRFRQGRRNPPVSVSFVHLFVSILDDWISILVEEGLPLLSFGLRREKSVFVDASASVERDRLCVSDEEWDEVYSLLSPTLKLTPSRLRLIDSGTRADLEIPTGRILSGGAFGRDPYAALSNYEGQATLPY